MSTAILGSGGTKLRRASGDSTSGAAPTTVGAQIARGIFSAVTTSSRSQRLKAQCVTVRFVIVQPCLVVQQRGSCLDCHIGGKPLRQIATTTDSADTRNMRRTEFYSVDCHNDFRNSIRSFFSCSFNPRRRWLS